MNQLGIRRAALAVLRQHRNHAANHAAEQASALLSNGEIEKARNWIQVVRSIDSFIAMAPEGETAH
jgi:hypothetical protein